MRLRPKIVGTGRVVHRCAVCAKPVEGDPIFLSREGRLVAFHADCYTKEN